MAVYTQDIVTLIQAGIRVILFVAIAGVITLLSLGKHRSEQVAWRLNEFHQKIIADAFVWFMVVDHDGSVQVWNRAAEEMSGYRSEEVVGKSSIWDELIPDGESRRVMQEYSTRFRGGEAGQQCLETSIRTRTGRVRQISWHINGMKDCTGETGSIIVIGVDVTDRSAFEKALRQQMQFLQVLIDTFPVPVFYKNREGVYTGCNQAFEQAFGKSRDQVIGKTVHELGYGDLAEIGTVTDNTLFSSPRLHEYDYPLFFADGIRHHVIIYKAPLFGDDNQISGVVGVIFDVTDLKQGEEALRLANDKLRLLTGLTRHDILNQINTVQLLLSLAYESSDQEDVRWSITRARKAGDLIEATIGFTKEYENFGTCCGAWQPVHQMIEDARRQIAKGPVIIKNEVSENIEIYGDPIIRKVIVSLLDNAIRHGGLITWVRFLCVRRDSSLIIVCEDNGIGISDSEKNRIFNHGYGVNSGLGLYLAREILSIFGFSIRETGTAGKGARFEIEIPIEKVRIGTESPL